MHRRPPPICPIKGHVLPSWVSQSLALESSTSQNLTVTDTLDYALHHPCLDNYCHALVSLFHSCCLHHIITHRIILAMSSGLGMTSCRLLSSTKRKNHKCHHMTSDAAVAFSSCPINTPTSMWNQRSRSCQSFLHRRTAANHRKHPSAIFLPRVLKHIGSIGSSVSRISRESSGLKEI